MSRFIDINATTRVTLPFCQCPNQNHPEGDWADVRQRWPGLDLIAVWDASDGETRSLRLINRGVVAWSLLDDNDQPLPIGVDSIRLLDWSIVSILVDKINAVFEEQSLPNGSGARSQATRRASGSRARKAATTS